MNRHINYLKGYQLIKSIYIYACLIELYKAYQTYQREETASTLAANEEKSHEEIPVLCQKTVSGDFFVPPIFSLGKTHFKSKTASRFFPLLFYDLHQMAQFNSVDPIINKEEALENPQMWNLYAYCENNPITYLDPDGRMVLEMPIIVKLAQTAVKAAASFFGASNIIGWAVVGTATIIASVVANNSPDVNWTTITQDSSLGGVGYIPTIESLSQPADIDWGPIFNNKQDQKVSDVLKNKKGSIKQAPLPPGSPGWKDIAKLTMGEIIRRANLGKKGYKTIKKLLTDKRFNR